MAARPAHAALLLPAGRALGCGALEAAWPETEEEARGIAASKPGDEGSSVWRDPSVTSCVDLSDELLPPQGIEHRPDGDRRLSIPGEQENPIEQPRCHR